MKLQEIKDHWKKDCVIDHTKFETELIKVSRLHSKYFSILANERNRCKMYEIEYNRLKKIKREYYLGRLPRKVVTQRGWDPIEYEIRPSDLSDYLKGDVDLCNIEKNLALQEIKLELLKNIIESLNKRGLNIRTAVDWIKFKQGVS